MDSTPQRQQAKLDSDTERRLLNLEAFERDCTARAVDYAAWRGGVDRILHAHTEQLTDLAAGLHGRLGELRAEINGRFDRMDEGVRETIALQRQTNGNVTRHEVRLTKIETVDDAEDQAERDRRDGRRFTVAQFLVGMTGAASLAAFVAQLVH